MRGIVRIKRKPGEKVIGKPCTSTTPIINFPFYTKTNKSDRSVQRIKILSNSGSGVHTRRAYAPEKIENGNQVQTEKGNFLKVFFLKFLSMQKKYKLRKYLSPYIFLDSLWCTPEAIACKYQIHKLKWISSQFVAHPNVCFIFTFTFPVCGASKCSAAARLHLVRGVARLQAKEYAAPGEADILNMAALEKHCKSAKLP